MNHENRIRAAWWDRKERKYDYGCWHNRSNLPTLRQWISLQNDLYPTVFYWVEENHDDTVINLKIKQKIKQKKTNNKPTIKQKIKQKNTKDQNIKKKYTNHDFVIINDMESAI